MTCVCSPTCSMAGKKKAVDRGSGKRQKNAVERLAHLPVDRLVTIAGVVLGSALCIYILHSSVTGASIETLNVHDTTRLKSVLFGGEPWLVHCVNNRTGSQTLPEVLTTSARDLEALGLRLGTLGCWEHTSSGRSVAERFQLKKRPPLTFVIANGNKPKVVELESISTGEALVKKVKPALKIETQSISSPKTWSSHCASRRTCIVVGYKHTAERETATTLFRPLLASHRAVKVVTLDTSAWQLKLDDRVLATRSGRDGGGGADVVCLARDDGADGGNATYSGIFLSHLTSHAVSAFFDDCEARTGLIPMPSMPKVKARERKAKVVTPEPYEKHKEPARTAPSPPKKDTRANVDHVGSREKIEEADPLFETVDEDEEAEGNDDDGGEGQEDDVEEVEL